MWKFQRLHTGAHLSGDIDDDHLLFQLRNEKNAHFPASFTKIKFLPARSPSAKLK